MNIFQIRDGYSTRFRNTNTIAIQHLVDELIEDEDEDRIQTFLRKAGHRINGYISQVFGPYPGK